MEASPVLSISEKPKIILQRSHRVLDGQHNANGKRVMLPATGLYKPAENEIFVTLKQNPFLLRPLNNKVNSVGETAAHELDHWAQGKLSRTNNLAQYKSYSLDGSRISKISNPYYHVNPNSDFFDRYPDVKKLPFRFWESSPYEWRSVLVGTGFTKKLDPDIIKWSDKDKKEVKSYLKNRFLGSYYDLRKINPNLDLSEIILDIPKRGYKHGGNLNYLKHYK